MLTTPDRYRQLYDYEKQSHARVVESLGTLQKTGPGTEFQKALDLVGHLMAARQMWLYRLGAIGDRVEDMFPVGVTMADLTARIATVEKLWSGYLTGIDEAELDRVIEYQSFEGPGFRSRVEDVLAQLYGHSLYHRGQISMLVRSAGGQPAETDFIFWTREAIGD